MKTKNLFIISLLYFAFFLSCKNPNGFKIEGILKNSQGETVILDVLKDKNLEPVDSIKVDAQGKFEFSGLIYEPNFYLLRTSTNNMITLLINPGEEIQIQADATSLTEYAVTGSADSKEIQEFNKYNAQKIKQLDSISSIYRENLNSVKFDSIKKIIDQVLIQLINEHKAYSKSFIKKNIHSFVSLYAVYQQFPPSRLLFEPVADFSVYNMIDSSLKIKYPEALLVKSLENFLSNEKEKNLQKEQSEKVTATGSLAPLLALPTPKGDTVSTAKFKGKYFLIDFWASWCKPCREENPNLLNSYFKYKDKGFEILQVSLDVSKEKWIEAIQNDKLAFWTHISDLKGWQSIAAKVYNIRSIPASFLIDAEGKIVAKNLRGEELDLKLAEIYNYLQNNPK